MEGAISILLLFNGGRQNKIEVFELFSLKHAYDVLFCIW